MQDYLFECRYQMDDRLWDEILRYYYFRRPLSVAIFVFSGVFFALGVGLGVWAYCLMGEVPVQTWEILVLSFVLPLLHIWLYTVARKNRRKQLRELYGDKTIEVTVAVGETEVYHRSSERAEASTVALSEIRRTFATEHTLCLVSRAKLMYIMETSGFTKGTAEDCKAFLKSKGIK